MTTVLTFMPDRLADHDSMQQQQQRTIGKLVQCNHVAKDYAHACSHSADLDSTLPNNIMMASTSSPPPPPPGRRRNDDLVQKLLERLRVFKQQNRANVEIATSKLQALQQQLIDERMMNERRIESMRNVNIALERQCASYRAAASGATAAGMDGQQLYAANERNAQLTQLLLRLSDSYDENMRRMSARVTTTNTTAATHDLRMVRECWSRWCLYVRRNRHARQAQHRRRLDLVTRCFNRWKHHRHIAFAGLRVHRNYCHRVLTDAFRVWRVNYGHTAYVKHTMKRRRARILKRVWSGWRRYCHTTITPADITIANTFHRVYCMRRAFHAITAVYKERQRSRASANALAHTYRCFRRLRLYTVCRKRKRQLETMAMKFELQRYLLRWWRTCVHSMSIREAIDALQQRRSKHRLRAEFSAWRTATHVLSETSELKRLLIAQANEFDFLTTYLSRLMADMRSLHTQATSTSGTTK